MKKFFSYANKKFNKTNTHQNWMEKWVITVNVVYVMSFERAICVNYNWDTCPLDLRITLGCYVRFHKQEKMFHNHSNFSFIFALYFLWEPGQGNHRNKIMNKIRRLQSFLYQFFVTLTCNQNFFHLFQTRRDSVYSRWLSGITEKMLSI